MIQYTHTSTTERKRYFLNPFVLAGNRNAVDRLAICSNVLWWIKIDGFMWLQSQASIKHKSQTHCRH